MPFDAVLLEEYESHPKSPFPTKEEFKEWLESMPPVTVVASHWTNTDCPIAQCMKARGAVSPHVYNLASYGWSDGREMKTKPLWVSIFVRAVDNMPMNAVTAKQCLSILANIL